MKICERLGFLRALGFRVPSNSRIGVGENLGLEVVLGVGSGLFRVWTWVS